MKQTRKVLACASDATRRLDISTSNMWYSFNLLQWLESLHLINDNIIGIKAIIYARNGLARLAD